MALTFPVYFLLGALRAAGWPKSTGFLRRKYFVDSRLLKVLYAGMLRHAMVLGAARPAIAVRLLVDTFQDRDWQTQPVEELLVALEFTSGLTLEGDEEVIDALIEADSSQAPWNSLIVGGFLDESVPWEALDTQSFLTMLHWDFGASLLWGLRHPEQVHEAVTHEAAHMTVFAREARAAGLDIPEQELESFQDAVGESDAFVASFESRLRPLVTIPDSVADNEEITGYLIRALPAGPC